MNCPILAAAAHRSRWIRTSAALLLSMMKKISSVPLASSATHTTATNTYHAAIEQAVTGLESGARAGIVSGCPELAGTEAPADAPAHPVLCSRRVPGSFDHLVSGGEQHRRYVEAERPGRLEINSQCEFRGLLHGRSPGLAPLRILSTKTAERRYMARRIRPIGHQAPASVCPRRVEIVSTRCWTARSAIRWPCRGAYKKWLHHQRLLPAHCHGYKGTFNLLDTRPIDGCNDMPRRAVASCASWRNSRWIRSL